MPSFICDHDNDYKRLLWSLGVIISFKLFFTGWSFLCSKSILGSPFKRGEQYHYWWQWRVNHLQSWPRGGRGRGWERLTGRKRGRNRETNHARGVRDTCTAENFIICHIASLVFMEGSKLDICNTGQNWIYTIHWRVKTSIFLLNFLVFFSFLSDWNASYRGNSSAKSPCRRVSYCQVQKSFQNIKPIQAGHT